MKLGELRKLAAGLPSLQEPDARQFHGYVRSLGMDPEALYQELEMTSAYVDTHRDTSFSNNQVQLHSHMFYELLYCCNNCGAEYLVGSERYRLQRGDVIFVPPGVSHRPLLPEQMTEPYNRYILWLSQSFMDWYAGLFDYPFTEKQATVGMLRTGGTQWECLGDLFYAGIREAEQQSDGWEASVIGNTMMLLTQIKRATDEQSASRVQAEQPELLDRIMAYVEAHYAESITIGEIARHFFVSNSTVSHLFKQKMGVSFHRYVTQRRLIAAKSLIEQDVHLETVGLLAGFSDYSGFYRAFKQTFGISPRKYRSLQETGKQAGE